MLIFCLKTSKVFLGGGATGGGAGGPLNKIDPIYIYFYYNTYIPPSGGRVVAGSGRFLQPASIHSITYNTDNPQ